MFERSLHTRIYDSNEQGWCKRNDHKDVTRRPSRADCSDLEFEQHHEKKARITVMRADHEPHSEKGDRVVEESRERIPGNEREARQETTPPLLVLRSKQFDYRVDEDLSCPAILQVTTLCIGS